MKLESIFYKEIKRGLPQISFTRIENSAAHGTPDALCYNKKQTFFTVEFKVTKRNKLAFSPHQISFHVRHPKNSFILLRVLVPRAIKLYEGNQIQELADQGHENVQPAACGLTACSLLLESL
jgi:hypothetical protein